MTCGDDGLFGGWLEVSHEFNRIASRCGATFSAGKHFVCTSPKRRAVFIERLYTFSYANKRLVGVDRHLSVPLKSIVEPETVTLAGERLNRLPRILRTCFAISNLVESFPASKPLVIRFLSRNPRYYKETAALGLRNGFLFSEGGSGLPIRREVNRDKVMLYKAQTGKSFPSLLRGMYDPMWALAEQLVLSDTINEAKGWELVDAKSDMPAGCDRLDYNYHVERSTALQYHSLILGIGPSNTYATRGLAYRKVREAVRAWWTDVDSFEPSPVELVYQVRRIASPQGRELAARWLPATQTTFATYRARLWRILADRATN